MAPKPERAPFEVADIVRRHGDQYRGAYPATPAQQAVLRHIGACRTAALGGHVDECRDCGHLRISYNSCRDRHCPKCQSLARNDWLEARLARLLPVPYFHLVFTIPDDIRPLALGNKRLVYSLLFAAAAETLKTLARDPKHLGAEIGFTAVLHTWGKNLLFHPHLHCVVTGGGLSRDGSRWIPARARFFLPVRVLGRLFRGKLLDALKSARAAGKLHFGASTAELADDRQWRCFLDGLYRKNWVVYAKPPFGGPAHVFRYLGRYTHRVAIANRRIVTLADGRVTFVLKDSKDDGKRKTLTVSAVEFLRRFLLHVLPQGFTRIRHFGLLAGRNVETRLPRARMLLEAQGRVPEPVASAQPDAPWWKRLLERTGLDLMACPCCGSRLVRTRTLAALPQVCLATGTDPDAPDTS